MKLVPKTSVEIARNANLQVKISLLGSEPLIWRRIIVPARINLAKLHQILQGVMGWQTSHLHEFVVEGDRYTDPHFDEFAVNEDDRTLDQSKVKLSDVAARISTFEYRYDFGDGWQHRVEIEKVLEPDQRISSPLCIGGQSACPPEDCGGMGGYGHFLEKLAEPKHPEHDETLAWIGGYFDPAAFDPNRINRDFLLRKKW